MGALSLRTIHSTRVFWSFFTTAFRPLPPYPQRDSSTGPSFTPALVVYVNDHGAARALQIYMARALLSVVTHTCNYRAAFDAFDIKSGTALAPPRLASTR